MSSAVSQICEHLGICFLTIKPGEPPKVLNLKEAIDDFFDTRQHTLRPYEAGLRALFDRLASRGGNGVKAITFDDYASFMQSKHIRVAREKIVGVCLTDAVTDKISYVSWVKLLLLASCSGDKAQLGSKNFKLLMAHLEVHSS